jgi:F-type H+-transporting ATPase subunit gamma
LSRGLTSMGRTAGRQQPVRGMATIQALRERVAAVSNIKKITSAMKMVAVCKLRKAQENLERSRAFQLTMADVKFEPAGDRQPTSKLYIGISSDRGLCGAINSSIARAIRDNMLNDKKEDSGVTDLQIMMIGEKAKQGIERMFKEHFTTTISEISKFESCTFKQTGELVDYWTKHDVESTSVFFQRFQSMIAYETTEDKYWNFAVVKDDVVNNMLEYEIEGDSDTLQNLYEFRNAIKMYQYFAENDTSTLSARMAAMDASSTNASDMIESLQLVMNRTRQAKITAELSEIIGGAAAQAAE